MSDKQIAEFIEVTHSSDGDARTYLTRANDDLQLALAMFLAEQPEPTTNARSASRSMSRSMSASSSRSSMHRAPRHRFATFSDLTKEEEGKSPSPSDGDDDPAQFFTGGERSGLAVTNPNDRRSTGGSGSGSDANNLVDEIIRKAQQRASEGDPEAQEATSSRRNQPRFSGKGFRLGSDLDDEHALVDEDDDDQFHDMEEDEDDDQPVLQRTMYFWRDGFSIDDGPLYRFDDPRNAIYLRAINMGRAPIELLKVNPHQPVDVKLVQKPDEDYVKPKVLPSLDNAGPGQRLGSAATMPTQPPVQAQAPVQQPPSQAQPSQPSTSLGTEGNAAVQLRLADGSSRRLRFDRDGAVQQLYDFIDIECPSGGRAYVLQTPLPPRKLEDKQLSLENAGIVGAVVVQRWI